MHKTVTQKTCSVDGCGGKHQAKGFCQKHYIRMKKYGDPLFSKCNYDHGDTCKVDGCSNPYSSKGFCRKHYVRLLKHGDPLYCERNLDHDEKCGADGCHEDYAVGGFCHKHYARFKRHGDPLHCEIKTEHGETCEIVGCEQPYRSQGMCMMHYLRWKRYGNHGPSNRFRNKPGEGVPVDGYIIVRRDGRTIKEHRWVMEQIIGRRLTREECVHHIDRDRANNSPHNLMLISSQREHNKLHHEEDVLGYPRRTNKEEA